MLLAFNTTTACTDSRSMCCPPGTPGPALMSYYRPSLHQRSRLLHCRGRILHISLLKTPENGEFWSLMLQQHSPSARVLVIPFDQNFFFVLKAVPHLSVQMKHSQRNAIPLTNCHLLASVSWKIPSWVLCDKATAYTQDLSCLSWLLFTLHCLLPRTYR